MGARSSSNTTAPARYRCHHHRLRQLAHPQGLGGPRARRELHIVDDDGNELGQVEIGTIYFGGQRRFNYHNERGKDWAPITRGWATTGMSATWEDGFLYLTDRKNFMIISGGVNIYPQEIENLLITHPKIADVAVFGIHEEFGEQVKAVVQPMNWADATDENGDRTHRMAADKLSHIKLPRSLDFHPKLPRMDNGKLYKRHLVEEYRAGTAARRCPGPTGRLSLNWPGPGSAGNGGDDRRRSFAGCAKGQVQGSATRTG